MHYRILADIVVVIHLAFILFTIAGAIFVVWWRWVFWFHLPAVIWASWIELSGNICPLTPLENWLRVKGGQGGYSSDFVFNYLLPILYPSGLTRKLQTILGISVIIINAAFYGYVFLIRKQKKINRRTNSEQGQ